jgi:hypothetical protein
MGNPPRLNAVLVPISKYQGKTSRSGSEPFGWMISVNLLLEADSTPPTPAWFHVQYYATLARYKSI